MPHGWELGKHHRFWSSNNGANWKGNLWVLNLNDCISYSKTEGSWVWIHQWPRDYWGFVKGKNKGLNKGERKWKNFK